MFRHSDADRVPNWHSLHNASAKGRAQQTSITWPGSQSGTVFSGAGLTTSLKTMCYETQRASHESQTSAGPSRSYVSNNHKGTSGRPTEGDSITTDGGMLHLGKVVKFRELGQESLLEG